MSITHDDISFEDSEPIWLQKSRFPVKNEFLFASYLHISVKYPFGSKKFNHMDAISHFQKAGKSLKISKNHHTPPSWGFYIFSTLPGNIFSGLWWCIMVFHDFPAFWKWEMAARWINLMLPNGYFTDMCKYDANKSSFFTGNLLFWIQIGPESSKQISASVILTKWY